jgi:hypothetical protein
MSLISPTSTPRPTFFIRTVSLSAESEAPRPTPVQRHADDGATVPHAQHFIRPEFHRRERRAIGGGVQLVVLGGWTSG